MIGKIIIAIVILLIVYTLYRWYFSGKADTTLFAGPLTAKKAFKIPASQVASGDTSRYSFSIWINVVDWSYKIGEEKIIYSRKDTSGRVGPEVVLGATDNTLTVYVDTQSGPSACTINQIPIQTWVNIIVVLNNRALDVYIDGKLTRTCVLPGVASLSNTAHIYVCPGEGSGEGDDTGDGFDGYVSSFRFWSFPLNPREAYEIYREGYAGVKLSVFERYRLKFAFLKDNKEMASFEI